MTLPASTTARLRAMACYVEESTARLTWIAAQLRTLIGDEPAVRYQTCPLCLRQCEMPAPVACAECAAAPDHEVEP